MHMQPFAFFLFGFGLIGTLFWLVTSIFWVWMLVDAITSATLNGTEKLIWVLVVLFTHLLGAILYFLLVRGQRGRL